MSRLQSNLVCLQVAIALVALSSRTLAADSLYALTTLEKHFFNLPVGHYIAGERSSSGDMYFLPYRQYAIQKISAATGGSELLTLHSVPEIQQSSRTTMVDDLALDGRGHLYIPAIWRANGPRTTKSGLFVLDASGQYDRTITFEPGVEVRRIDLDDSGNLYVLGIDPECFRHRSEKCFLVHKYSPKGDRLTSYSPCPNLDLRRLGDVRPGPDFDRLKIETDRGQLWVEKDSVFHVLPISRLLRVFDLNGTLLQEVSFEPPAATEILRELPQAGEPVVWDVLPVENGQYFIQWVNWQFEGRQRRGGTRYSCLHDAQGRTISAPAPLNKALGVPFFRDEAGYVYFIRQGIETSTSEWTRARVQPQ